MDGRRRRTAHRCGHGSCPSFRRIVGFATALQLLYSMHRRSSYPSEPIWLYGSRYQPVHFAGRGQLVRRDWISVGRYTLGGVRRTKSKIDVSFEK